MLGGVGVINFNWRMNEWKGVDVGINETRASANHSLPMKIAREEEKAEEQDEGCLLCLPDRHDSFAYSTSSSRVHGKRNSFPLARSSSTRERERGSPAGLCLITTRYISRGSLLWHNTGQRAKTRNKRACRLLR